MQLLGTAVSLLTPPTVGLSAEINNTSNKATPATRVPVMNPQTPFRPPAKRLAIEAPDGNKVGIPSFSVSSSSSSLLSASNNPTASVAVATTPAISTSTSAPKTTRLRLQKSIITPSHPTVSLPTPTDRDIPKASTDTSTTTDGTNLVVTASLHPPPPAPPPQVIEEDNTHGIGVTPLQWTEDEDAELLQLRLENERYIYTRTSTRRSPYVVEIFRFVAFNDRWTWGKIRETFNKDKEKSMQRTHDSIRKKRWARLRKEL